jgi:putative tricarboxylic transport membrane protein
LIGAYSLFDVGAMIAFGVLGYALRRNGFDAAPLLLAFALGTMFERNLR